MLRLRQCIDHQCHTFVIAHLAFAEQHDHGPTLTVAGGVQLRVQAAFGAPDTSGTGPFLKGSQR